MLVTITPSPPPTPLQTWSYHPGPSFPLFFLSYSLFVIVYLQLYSLGFPFPFPPPSFPPPPPSPSPLFHALLPSLPLPRPSIHFPSSVLTLHSHPTLHYRIANDDGRIVSASPNVDLLSVTTIFPSEAVAAASMPVLVLCAKNVTTSDCLFLGRGESVFVPPGSATFIKLTERDVDLGTFADGSRGPYVGDTLYTARFQHPAVHG